MVSRRWLPFRLLQIGDTNVVCFAVAEELDTVQQANERTESLLSFIKSSPELSVTRTHLGLDNYGSLVNAAVQQWNGAVDDDQRAVEHIVTTLLPSLEEGLR